MVDQELFRPVRKAAVQEAVNVLERALDDVAARTGVEPGPARTAFRRLELTFLEAGPRR